MIVGIGKIVNTVSLVHPGSFVKIIHSFHGLQCTVQLRHVVLEFGTKASASTTIVKVGLTIVVHKHIRIDLTILRKSFQPTLQHNKIGCRLVADRDTDLPVLAPGIFIGMGKVKVVFSIFIDAVGRPHEFGIV
ncbi:hypothetical protein SDC9_168681 [bioreactor metagenome]|uniref:Uncharacterized protein n=1 Tax=bioreactor metagenome TaxID=1076179 RepID=A0A645G5Q7_9ZZZZ